MLSEELARDVAQRGFDPWIFGLCAQRAKHCASEANTINHKHTITHPHTHTRMNTDSQERDAQTDTLDAETLKDIDTQGNS